VVPRGLAGELLEPLAVLVVQVGDGLGGLDSEVREQPPDVPPGVVPLLLPGEGRDGRAEERVRTGCKSPGEASRDVGVAAEFIQPGLEPPLQDVPPGG